MLPASSGHLKELQLPDLIPRSRTSPFSEPHQHLVAGGPYLEFLPKQLITISSLLQVFLKKKKKTTFMNTFTSVLLGTSSGFCLQTNLIWIPRRDEMLRDESVFCENKPTLLLIWNGGTDCSLNPPLRDLQSRLFSGFV